MGPLNFKLFKGLPRNKRFNYTPRYYKGKEGTKTSSVTMFAERVNRVVSTHKMLEAIFWLAVRNHQSSPSQDWSQ